MSGNLSADLISTLGSAPGGLPSSALESLLSTSPAANQDLRIRLAPLNPTAVFQNGGILSILQQTNGMLFPYTPQITFSQAVSYMDLQLVHSNTDYPAYTRTPSVTIGLNGRFTVQNQAEGQYALACLHFLRSVSKSYFGQNDPQAGLPPPVLVLSGYGNYMFNNLRVILKTHSWTFDDTVDAVTIQIDPTTASPLANAFSATQATGLASGVSAGTARIPSLFSIACELMVVQTPQNMRTQFSFAKFASGALMQSSTPGWI